MYYCEKIYKTGFPNQEVLNTCDSVSKSTYDEEHKQDFRKLSASDNITITDTAQQWH